MLSRGKRYYYSEVVNQFEASIFPNNMAGEHVLLTMLVTCSGVSIPFKRDLLHTFPWLILVSLARFLFIMRLRISPRVLSFSEHMARR